MPLQVLVASVEQEQCTSTRQISLYIKTPVNLYWSHQQTFKNIFTAVRSKLSCILWNITQLSDLQRNKNQWFMSNTISRSFGCQASCSHISRAKLVVLSVEKRHVQPSHHSLILNFITVPLWISEYLHITAEIQLVPPWVSLAQEVQSSTSPVLLIPLQVVFCKVQ